MMCFFRIQFFFDKFQSKAMQTRSNSFVNKLFCGKLGETSYAPLLFGLIVSEMVLFFTSIVAGECLMQHNG